MPPEVLDLPTSVKDWKRQTKTAMMDKAVGSLLRDLRDIKERPRAARDVKVDGTPREKPISLSGSTARLDDIYALRMIFKYVDPQKDLRTLQDFGYVDEDLWDKALESFDLRMERGVPRPRG